MIPVVNQSVFISGCRLRDARLIRLANSGGKPEMTSSLWPVVRANSVPTSLYHRMIA